MFVGAGEVKKTLLQYQASFQCETKPHEDVYWTNQGNKDWISEQGLFPQCNTQLCFHGNYLLLCFTWSFTEKKRKERQSETSPRSTCSVFSVMWCLAALSWRGHGVTGSRLVLPVPRPPPSSSDGDEASLVAGDGLRHHAATPPPGHTPLPVEFGVTTKSWIRDGKRICCIRATWNQQELFRNLRSVSTSVNWHVTHNWRAAGFAPHSPSSHMQSSKHLLLRPRLWALHSCCLRSQQEPSGEQDTEHSNNNNENNNRTEGDDVTSALTCDLWAAV